MALALEHEIENVRNKDREVSVKNRYLSSLFASAMLAVIVLAASMQLQAADPVAPTVPPPVGPSPVLSSTELTAALLGRDWTQVSTILAKDSNNLKDPRVLLLLGHSELALNRNNIASVQFATASDSTSTLAWDGWTAALASTSPKSPVALYLRGDALARRGNFWGSIGWFTGALKQDSLFALAFNARGVAYDFVGDPSAAAEDFDVAAKLDTCLADAHANVGVMLLSRGIAKGAQDNFAKAISCDPRYGLAYNGRACARSKLGDKNGAYHDIRLADSVCGVHPFISYNYQTLIEKKDSSQILVARPRGNELTSRTIDYFKGGLSADLNYTAGGRLGMADYGLGGQGFGAGATGFFKGGLGDYGGMFEKGKIIEAYRGGVFVNAERVEVEKAGVNPQVGTEYALFYPRPERIQLH
jgi:tetratricopeptide (TPR) repeat protein